MNTLKRTTSMMAERIGKAIILGWMKWVVTFMAVFYAVFSAAFLSVAFEMDVFFSFLLENHWAQVTWVSQMFGEGVLESPHHPPLRLRGVHLVAQSLMREL